MIATRIEVLFRALVAIGLIVWSTALPAHAAPSVTVHRVSDQSPFAAGACGSDIQAAVSAVSPVLGTVALHGSEREPAFAITPEGLVAAWIQDAALGIVAAHSSDGGSTWAQNVPPALSICEPGGTRMRVVDPRLVVDGNGTTFLSDNGSFPDFLAQVTVSSSPDGGATWSAPTTLSTSVGNDYTTMSADPADPHAVAVVWQSLLPELTWFARTADDGGTWSTAVPIRVAPPGAHVVNSLATLPNGTLVDVVVDYPLISAVLGRPDADVTGHGVIVGALRSTDNGSTWSETTIATLGDRSFWWVMPAPDPAVGPDGAVYVLIPDADNGATAWRLFRSPDGAAWSQVATVPLSDAFDPTIRLDLIPHVAIASDGTIGVLYDDHRNDVQTDQELTTDVWLTYSHDGGTTWNDLHLGGPFDFNTIPGGVGDYEELKAIGNDFGSVFALGAPAAAEGPTDIFFARISF